MADETSTDGQQAASQPTKADDKRALIEAYFAADAAGRRALCDKNQFLKQTFSEANHPA